MITQTDASKNTITYEYDALGRTVKETDALGNKTSYTYDALGDQTSITNALGKVSKNEYNSSSLLTKETDANGNVIAYEYDKKGNLSKTTDALGGVISYTYDKASQLIEEVDALGSKTTYTYDARGNVLVKTDAKGNKTSYDYNKSGNLTKVTDSGVNGGIDTGNVTKYSYDKLGNLTEQTRVGKSSDKDQTTTYEYDKNGSLTKLTDPSGESITYIYDADGKLTKEVQKDGATTKYTYDKVGNEKKITYSDNRSVSYTYTSTDQVKTTTDWNGTTAYEYDANGQVTKVTEGNNQTIEYTWTKLGQKKSIKYLTSDSVSYTYDNNGNLTKVTDTNSGVTNYTYDALNQVKTKNLPNGAVSTYTYDKNGWLTQREETSNGASKQSYTYEYDKNGNRIKETKVSSGTTETTRYTYDVLNQLTSVVDKKGTRNYAFDEFNNRTAKEEIGKETTQYTYNNLNQLVETVQGNTVTTYDYDKRGNVAEVEENGNTKQTYVFDSTNKMSKVVTYKDNTSGSGTSTVTTKYTYDGVGNRVSAKVELNGSVTINTTYVVDGESAYNDIIMAKDSISGKTSVFTFSDEVISVETSGNISYYRNDEKHSVTDILDTTGKVKATIEYDEYGVIVNPEVVSTGGNIFAYTGHVYEESTGLYYAKARYYDAGIGRFVSEDSYRGEHGDPASLNLYVYGMNSPLKYTDPSGNMNYFTQTDDLIKGAIKGMGSWLWDIIKSPIVLITIIKQLVCGELTVKQVLEQGLDYLVKDVKYVAKHLNVFKPWKKYSNQTVYEMGYHTGRVICLVVSAILAGKGIASKFGKSKVGKKIITKAQKSGIKITKSTKMKYDLQIFAKQGNKSTSLTLYNPEFAARQMLDGGKVSASVLKTQIPKGTPNTFKPSSTIAKGYKYNFKINGTNIEIKWHSPDMKAAAKYPGSNSGSVWTAQIKIGKKVLGANGKFYKTPSNLTHIPLKGE